MVRPASYYVDDLFHNYNLKKSAELEKSLNYKSIDREIKRLDRDINTDAFAKTASKTKEQYIKDAVEKGIKAGNFCYTFKGRKAWRSLLQFANKPKVYREGYLERVGEFADEAVKVPGISNRVKEEAKSLKELGAAGKIASLFEKYGIGRSRYRESNLKKGLYSAAKRKTRELTDILREETLTIVLLLIGAFFISMSREGMYFTGNLVKEQSFVAINGLGIGVILLIAALVVLFVKVLLRKH